MAQASRQYTRDQLIGYIIGNLIGCAIWIGYSSYRSRETSARDQEWDRQYQEWVLPDQKRQGREEAQEQERKRAAALRETHSHLPGVDNRHWEVMGAVRELRDENQTVMGAVRALQDENQSIVSQVQELARQMSGGG
ncbi:MAG: hypothetical protein M1817_002610 [Caeruleum heppii]|nr:MAG: hypothetical protein M1817_002610 [Caeruleum heppii]